MLQSVLRALLYAITCPPLILFSATAWADEFPSKPIRLIVPFPAGGIIDIVSRTVSPGLAGRLGQPVVVDNRPGAGGNIGAALAAKSPADGYTLFMGLISTHAINQSLYKTLPYDPIKDFSPISLVAKSPLILLVNASVPVRSVEELITYANANPGKLNFASAGNGSPSHIALAMFTSMARVNLVHVPYRGAAPAQVDLLASNVQGYFGAQAAELPHIQSGKLRALGVGGTERLPALPDVATISQTVPGYQFNTWFGILAPAGLPTPLATKLNQAIRATLADDAVIKRLTEHGLQPFPSSPEEFATFIQSEALRLGKIVRETGAQAE